MISINGLLNTITQIRVIHDAFELHFDVIHVKDTNL